MKIILTAFAFLVTLVTLAMVTSQAQATQDAFDVIPINENFDLNTMEGVDPDDRTAAADARKLRSERNGNRTRARGLARDILNEEAPLGGNEAEFDIWFNEVIFAQMTQLNPESLSALGEQRKSFFDQYLRRASNQEAINHLVRDLAFEEMKKMVAGNYHPAVRVNAMIMIGQLDITVGVNNRRAPTPLVEALPYLVSQLTDAATPDYLKAAGMVGVLRHCEIDGQKDQGQRLPQAQRDAVVTEMLAILGDAPDGRDATVHEWMQRQAIRTLGSLRMPGSANEVPGALYARLIDDTSIWVKCDAARAYGMIEFPSKDIAKPDEVTTRLAEIAVQAARAEVAFLEDKDKQLKDLEKWRTGVTEVDNSGFGGNDPDLGSGLSGAGGQDGGSSDGGSGDGGDDDGGYGDGGGDSGFGGFGGSDETAGDRLDVPVYVGTLSRRRIKMVLVSIQEAIGDGDPAQATTGVSRFETDAAKQQTIDDLRTAVNELLQATDAGLDPDDDDVNRDPLVVYTDALTRAANNLERAITIGNAEPETNEGGNDGIGSGE